MRIASGYRLVIEADPDVGFIGTTVELPYVAADGPTVDRCARETLAATAAAVAAMLELGQRPPAPARERRREQQINLRVTSDERMKIEEAARRQGYRSVSDFIRAAALSKSA